MIGVLGATAEQHPLWRSPRALSADLSSLTEALDDPDVDLADTLRRLAAVVTLAVPSYVGLTISCGLATGDVTLTSLEREVAADDIRTSLLLPLPPAPDDGRVPLVSVTLYAGHPGAFIDLTADLAWLTGRPLTDFVLDRDLGVPEVAASPSGLAVAALINQAIGVLIGHGHTPERASRELDARAARLGVDRHRSAIDILAELTGSATESS